MAPNLSGQTEARESGVVRGAEKALACLEQRGQGHIGCSWITQGLVKGLVSPQEQLELQRAVHRAKNVRCHLGRESGWRVDC
jgi:hypothetical protein